MAELYLYKIKSLCSRLSRTEMGWLSFHVLIGYFICNVHSCLFDAVLLLKDPTHAAFKEKMKEFMANFDKNSDGRIEMTEVRNITAPLKIYSDYFITSCAEQQSVFKPL